MVLVSQHDKALTEHSLWTKHPYFPSVLSNPASTHRKKLLLLCPFYK
jgi:hypothetical protein